ncbi:fam-c protein [Plasmodium vinckei petteri]|uniref:Fam-c protein n=1 Tax=Plasmodium vinckei petteri TaxID=138298 RepID=A0A6V7SPT9_PLAVN|nr:fam-c protein [Plasmodium vinckei petteri]
MNRRIFSLVCIALYALLDASIYCSQQKESDARNKSVRGTKENLYSKLPSNLSSDKMIKIFLDDHKDLPTNKLEFTEYILNIFLNDPEQRNFLFELYSKLSKEEALNDHSTMISNYYSQMK